MAEVSSKLYQLIYAGSDVEEIIRKAYPEAKITDASDYIHTERFECEIAGVEEDEFFIFALRQGFAQSCLAFQLHMQGMKKDSHQKVWDLIAEASALDESEEK